MGYIDMPYSLRLKVGVVRKFNLKKNVEEPLVTASIVNNLRL